jgi:hypothetical protein
MHYLDITHWKEHNNMLNKKQQFCTFLFFKSRIVISSVQTSTHNPLSLLYVPKLDRESIQLLACWLHTYIRVQPCYCIPGLHARNVSPHRRFTHPGCSPWILLWAWTRWSRCSWRQSRRLTRFPILQNLLLFLWIIPPRMFQSVACSVDSNQEIGGMASALDSSPSRSERSRWPRSRSSHPSCLQPHWWPTDRSWHEYIQYCISYLLIHPFPRATLLSPALRRSKETTRNSRMIHRHHAYR